MDLPFSNIVKIKNIAIFSIILITIIGYFTIFSYLPVPEIFARCPDGYHKSPSGDCEKVINTKGMPRCPDGYNRSPDGDCEKVSNVDRVKNDNSDENINNPFKQIFGNNDNGTVKFTKLNVTNDYDYNNYVDDDIELEGKVTHIVDGDTLDINDIRIRLSLVDTPERGEDGYKEATNFVKDLCFDKKGEVDIDNGQRGGDRYGREVGVVYCDGININKELVENNLARIYTEFCNISEFKNEKWAKPYC